MLLSKYAMIDERVSYRVDVFYGVSGVIFVKKKLYYYYYYVPITESSVHIYLILSSGDVHEA